MSKMSANFGDPAANASTIENGKGDVDIDALLADVMGGQSETTEPEQVKQTETPEEPEQVRQEPEPEPETAPEEPEEPEGKPTNADWARLRKYEQRLKQSEQAGMVKLKDAEAQGMQRLQTYFAAEQAKLEEGKRALEGEGMRAYLEYKRTGDTAFLVDFLEKDTGESYDELQRAIIERRKRSPHEVKALKDAAELRARLEKLEQERAQQSQQQSAEQVRAQELGIIKSRLAGSDAAKAVPKLEERTYRLLLADKQANGVLTMTVEEAGAEVLRQWRAWQAKNGLAPVAPASQQSPVTPKAPEKAKEPRATITHNDPTKRRSAGTAAPKAPADDDSDDIDLIVAQVMGGGKRK